MKYILIIFIIVQSCTPTSEKNNQSDVKENIIESSRIDLKTRKEIFFEIGKRQDNMSQYADNNFSSNEFEKRAEYERDKVTEIKENIINEYEISEDEYFKIYSEGIKNNW
tara:strand:- start:1099 stop:1428 length:330 start_codon:yes stop_codon:yes gene_type:complete